MRTIVKLVLAIALPTLLGCAQSSGGGNWVSLFNGKDLTGWQKNGTENWTVQDGAILGESTTNKYGYLTTDKTYRDFTLRLRFKSLAEGNSGVFVRSHIIGIDPEHGPDIEGMQVEVDPTRNTGSIYESGHRGWVAMGTPDSAASRAWPSTSSGIKGASRKPTRYSRSRRPNASACGTSNRHRAST